jgi:hypothetical protein
MIRVNIISTYPIKIRHQLVSVNSLFMFEPLVYKTNDWTHSNSIFHVWYY